MSTDQLVSLQLAALDVMIAASRGAAHLRDAMIDLDQAATPLAVATGAQYLAAAAQALRDLAAMTNALAAKTEDAARRVAVESGFVPPISAE